MRFAVTGRPRGDLSAWPPNLTPTGFLSDVAYWRQLARSAAVAVLTTRPETLLSGGYEALVLGRPLVTSDHAALRGYFGDAAVYAHAEPASLAGAVRTALDGADDYAGRLRRACGTAARRVGGGRRRAARAPGEDAVSGLVAFFSPDPAVRALGSDALGDLAAAEGYVTQTIETADAWFGVVGWPDAVSLHVDGDPGSPAVVVAFSGDLLNAPVLRRELALPRDGGGRTGGRRRLRGVRRGGPDATRGRLRLRSARRAREAYAGRLRPLLHPAPARGAARRRRALRQRGQGLPAASALHRPARPRGARRARRPRPHAQRPAVVRRGARAAARRSLRGGRSRAAHRPPLGCRRPAQGAAAGRCLRRPAGRRGDGGRRPGVRRRRGLPAPDRRAGFAAPRRARARQTAT